MYLTNNQSVVNEGSILEKKYISSIVFLENVLKGKNFFCETPELFSFHKDGSSIVVSQRCKAIELWWVGRRVTKGPLVSIYL